jgi:hypothetical protein
VIWGSVAASFTIEQDGLPVMIISQDGELWNGETCESRVGALKARLLPLA